MRTLGLFEAKQKLSELVDRAGKANASESLEGANWQRSLSLRILNPVSKTYFKILTRSVSAPSGTSELVQRI